MSLLLIRHGQALREPGDLDPGLSSLGLQQATAVGEALSKQGFTEIVCSPLRRTRETAAPLAGECSLSPRIEPAVAEVFPPELDAAEREALLGPLLSGSWSDQSQELQAWRSRALQTLLELGRDPTRRVVVFSHFVALNAALGAARRQDRVTIEVLPHASISEFRVVRGELVEVEAGGVHHLPPELVTSQLTRASSAEPPQRSGA